MAPVLLRIRTKDGTERLQAEAGAALADLKQQIAQSFSVPIDQQASLNADPCWPSCRLSVSSIAAAAGICAGSQIRE